MKKHIASIILFLSIGISSYAQYKPYKKYPSLRERSQKYTKEITDYVSGITPSQDSALLAINIDITTQFDSLKKLKLESDLYRPAARAIFVARDENISKILNEKQFDEFLMLQEEKRMTSYKRKQEQIKINSTNTGENNTNEPQKKYKKYFVKDNVPSSDSSAVKD